MDAAIGDVDDIAIMGERHARLMARMKKDSSANLFEDSQKLGLISGDAKYTQVLPGTDDASTIKRPLTITGG